MAFYKLCPCGAKSLFEHRGLAPRKCAACGRSLLEISAADESREQGPAEDAPTDAPPGAPGLSIRTCLYSLEGPGFSIKIPPAGGTVGRASLGAENLASYGAVSRSHVRVSYRGSIGLVLEDCSRYGTFVDGERLIRGAPRFVTDGHVVRLYDVELTVKKHDGE